MNELEITRLCAAAMGGWIVIDDTVHLAGDFDAGRNRIKYDPLRNDAQAMALVKKFQLRIGLAGARLSNLWFAERSSETYTTSNDLNRAICECVAKMQAAKSVDGS